MSVDYRGPRPYRPGDGIYPTDAETEVDFRLTEKRCPGRAGFKWQALIRDGFYCRDWGRGGSPPAYTTRHRCHAGTISRRPDNPRWHTPDWYSLLYRDRLHLA
jgi:hypothetical protein